jgi:glycerophosphoryl diester phosphodiesterase
MLIIGHRGAAGLKPENTIASLRAGMKADADMIEFDIRLTKDNILVLAHDFHTLRSHKTVNLIHSSTLSELRKRAAGSDRPIVTFEEALNETFGKIMLNVELKHKGSGQRALEVLRGKYIKKASDWDLLLFSSFSVRELRRVRKLAPKAHLALLQSFNPFLFIAVQRQLQLDAVGFHRLYIQNFALEVAKKAKLFTYAYTVNRPAGALRLAQLGIDGVVTDYPDKMREYLDKAQQ